MKAFVLFSPIDDEEKAEGKTIDTLKQTALETATKTVEGMLAGPEDTDQTSISILPVFLEGLEFIKGTGEVTPLVLFTEEGKEKQNDPLFRDRFRYMQFVDSASVKLTGKIVTLSIKSEGETEKEGEQGIFKGIFDYSKMGKEEQLLFRQKTGKTIVEYLANLAVINSLNDWAISEKQSLKKSGKPGQGKIDPIEIGMGEEKDTVLGDKAKKERDPSKAVSAYTKIKKSMLVLYFNDYKPEDYELKTNSDDWESSKTAKEVHERERAEMMLSNINKSISETDKKIKELQKEMKQREFEKNTEINEINTMDPDSEIKMLEAEKELLDPSDPEINILDEKIKFANDVKSDRSTMIEERENKYKKYNSAAEAKLERLEREQRRLINERNPIKEDTERAQKEYKSKDKQQNMKDYIESILGINIGIPVRYMYIPETQIVSYAENMTLSSSSEGRFELIVKQVPGSQKPVEVGNPVTGGFRVLKKMLGGIFQDFGSVSGGRGYGGNEI